jgi:septum formation protein
MITQKKLILASASPRREELLSRLGVSFSVQSAAIDEARLANESPREMTERLSLSKARAILNQLSTPAWVLGADTTVALSEVVFGKPASRTDAVQTLTQLSGKTHQVISSISLVSTGYIQTESVISSVSFGKLSADTIAAYCDTDEPYDKAGSYGIQGQAGAFVEHIDGDYSAIVGLPLWTTAQLLRTAKLIK